MNVAVVKALAGLVPTGALLVGSSTLYVKTRTISSVMQLVGAGCLVLVDAFHFCEALAVLPWMRWGEPQSAGHYLDLSCALAGIVLFPIGYLMHTLRGQNDAAGAPSSTATR